MRTSISDQAEWYVKRVMWVRVSKWDCVCNGNGLLEDLGYMGSSGNWNSPLASRSVLNDFTDDATSISEPRR